MGYVDKKGREVIECEYDLAESFSEGLAVVEKDGKWGYVDKNGNEVIKCKYDRAESFSEGLAHVWKDYGLYIIALRPILFLLWLLVLSKIFILLAE